MDEQCACALTELVRNMVYVRDDLRALAVCGSWARGDAQPTSDLDLLVIATEPADWRRDLNWITGLPYYLAGCAYHGHRIAPYGIAWSAHIALTPHAELELTFAPVSWAQVDPVDPGTCAVVAGGFESVLDKDDRIARLVQACGRPVRQAGYHFARRIRKPGAEC